MAGAAAALGLLAWPTYQQTLARSPKRRPMHAVRVVGTVVSAPLALARPYLNYRPILVGLGGFAEDPEIQIRRAAPEDAAEISAVAGQIFDSGRLYVDPQVGPEIGSRRYGAWAANVFHHPGQRVLKCCTDARTVAFMAEAVLRSHQAVNSPRAPEMSTTP